MDVMSVLSTKTIKSPIKKHEDSGEKIPKPDLDAFDMAGTVMESAMDDFG